jgi:DNA-binding transcriptional LysR family regulator
VTAAQRTASPASDFEVSIRMTATQHFGRTEVAPLIDRFLDLHPAVQIALHLSDGVVDLVEQDIDLEQIPPDTGQRV